MFGKKNTNLSNFDEFEKTINYQGTKQNKKKKENIAYFFYNKICIINYYKLIIYKYKIYIKNIKEIKKEIKKLKRNEREINKNNI